MRHASDVDTQIIVVFVWRVRSRGPIPVAVITFCAHRVGLMVEMFWRVVIHIRPAIMPTPMHVLHGRSSSVISTMVLVLMMPRTSVILILIGRAIVGVILVWTSVTLLFFAILNRDTSSFDEMLSAV